MLELERQGSWREAAASKSEKSKIASLSLSLAYTGCTRRHQGCMMMREREEGGREREAGVSGRQKRRQMERERERIPFAARVSRHAASERVKRGKSS